MVAHDCSKDGGNVLRSQERGESSLAALVGVGLLFPDATVVALPVMVEALGVPPEFCKLLAKRDFSTVVIMLRMSAVVTVF